MVRKVTYKAHYELPIPVFSRVQKLEKAITDKIHENLGEVILSDSSSSQTLAKTISQAVKSSTSKVMFYELRFENFNFGFWMLKLSRNDKNLRVVIEKQAVPYQSDLAYQARAILFDYNNLAERYAEQYGVDDVFLSQSYEKLTTILRDYSNNRYGFDDYLTKTRQLSDAFPSDVRFSVAQSDGYSYDSQFEKEKQKWVDTL